MSRRPGDPSLDASAGMLLRQGLDLVMDWADGASCRLSAWRDGREGIHGELTVTLKGHRLSWGGWTLSSTTTRDTLAKRLTAQAPHVAWGAHLEDAAFRFTQAARTGSPVVTVVPRLREGPRHLLAPIAPHAETTVLYGPGGSGKGYLGLAMALAISCQATVPHFEAQVCGPVLYLDWESTEEEFSDRAYQLAKGLGCQVNGALHYKQMHAPLTVELAAVQAAVHQHQVACVFVDSLMQASGFEPEGAEAASRTFTALRTLDPVTRIVIAHVTKTAAEGMTRSKPFGSIFIENLARSTWEVSASEEADGADLVMALRNEKVNSGRKHRPLALRFHYEAEAITLTAGDLGDQPDLLQGLSLKDQLRYALQHRGPQTVAELADTASHSIATVRMALNRHVSTFVSVGTAQPGQPQLWALRIRAM